MSLNLQRPESNKVKYDRTVLIDSDLLCYAISDPVIYTVKNGLQQEFRYKKEAVSYCKDNKLDPEIIGKRIGEPEPLSNALHSVKMMIQGIIEGCQANPRLILSSPTNFRYELEETYKANRKDTKKPYHYDNIKQYLLNKWSAEIAPDGLEADDFLVQLCKEDPELIIASLDKDYMTAVCKMYKWRGHGSQIIFEITQEDADNFLAAQLLFSDTADNIISPVKPKLKDGSLAKSGFGKAKARDFLLQYDTADDRMYAVRRLYVEQGYFREYNVNLRLLDIGCLRWK